MKIQRPLTNVPTQTASPEVAINTQAPVAELGVVDDHFQQSAPAVQVDQQAATQFAQSTQTPRRGVSSLSLQMAEGMGTTEISSQAAVAELNHVQQRQQVGAAQQVAAPTLTEAQKNEETVQKFYTALQNKDLDTLLSLYHPDAVFSDPAYPNLKGDKLKSMWKLITGSDTLEVAFRDVKANADGSVSGHWDGDYTLIKGNPIHNSIDSTFKFKDGKIISHTDSFSFSKWADQAFPGVLGKFLGTRVGHFLMRNVVLPFTLR